MEASFPISVKCAAHGHPVFRLEADRSQLLLYCIVCCLELMVDQALPLGIAGNSSLGALNLNGIYKQSCL